jgi:hypothetical protein
VRDFLNFFRIQAAIEGGQNMVESPSGFGPASANKYDRGLGIAPGRDTRRTLKIDPGAAGAMPAPQPVTKNTGPHTTPLSPPAQALLKAGNALEAYLKAKGTPQEAKLHAAAITAAEDSCRAAAAAYEEKVAWIGPGKVTEDDYAGKYAALSLLRRAEDKLLGRAENSFAHLHQLRRDIDEAGKRGDWEKLAELSDQYNIFVKQNLDAWLKAKVDLALTVGSPDEQIENDVARDGFADAESHMNDVYPGSIPNYIGGGHLREPPPTWQEQVALVDKDYKALQQEKKTDK